MLQRFEEQTTQEHQLYPISGFNTDPTSSKTEGEVTAEHLSHFQTSVSYENHSNETFLTENHSYENHSNETFLTENHSYENHSNETFLTDNHSYEIYSDETCSEETAEGKANSPEIRQSVTQEVTADTDIEALMATIHREVRRQTRVRYALRFVNGVILVTFVVLFLKSLYTSSQDIYTYLPYMGMVGLFGAVAASSKEHKQAAEQLAQVDDIRAVGPLTESLIIEDKGIAASVKAALIRLLPRLKASDAQLLNAAHRKTLNQLLSWGLPEEVRVHIGSGKTHSHPSDLVVSQMDERNKDERHKGVMIQASLETKKLENKPPDILLIAILKSYEQVGGEEELGIVQKVAQAPASQLLSQEVIDAAQECIPFLSRRVESLKQSMTLLRGSYAVDAAPETLLRPSVEHHSKHDEPDKLLRAVDSVTND